MDGVILTGFDLDRQNACAFIVINQEIDLSFLLVVIIEKIVSVRLQFLGDDTFIDGTKVQYKNTYSYRFVLIFILGVGSTVLIAFSMDEDLKKKTEERKKALLYEYPEFISKLALLMGAGMSLNGALRRIYADHNKNLNPLYEELGIVIHNLDNGILEERAMEELLLDLPQVLSKMALLINSGMVLREAWKKTSETGDRALFQEMRVFNEEVRNGASDYEAFMNFADRCSVKEIRKVISTLMQNMQKGNKELALQTPYTLNFVRQPNICFP